MTDLHIHTAFSFDCEEPAESYLRAAKTRGDGALGFSEHCDYDALLEGESPDNMPDLTAFFKQTDCLRREYPDVRLLRGVELGFCVRAVPYYRQLLQKYPFDYAIVSVHTLTGRGDCYFPRFFEGWTKEQAYAAYLSALYDSVRADLDFQIVGHIGYVARYAPYEDGVLRYGDFPDIFDNILRTIICRGLSLELNTSTKGGGAFVTDESILERYLALGGKNFTFGSDAHSVDRYREGEERARAFLLSHGVGEICRYEGRKLIREKL